MKKMILALLSMSLVLSACSKPKIDTSTDQTMERSMKKVKESLPANKQQEFEESLKVVAFGTMDRANVEEVFRASFSGEPTDTKAIEAGMKESVEGKTGEEVIALAQKIRTEQAGITSP